MTDDYHQRSSLNYSSLPTKNYELDDDDDVGPTNYSMIQNELGRIQNDIRGHMNRMDTKLTDIKVLLF